MKMIELFSIKETAKIFGLSPSQLRYWTQTGFVSPTVRRNGRMFYTFRDLVGVKAASELLATGKTLVQARSSLDALRDQLPEHVTPETPLSISSDGSSVEVHREDEAGGPPARRIVVAFRLSSLATQIADVLKRPVAAMAEPPSIESQAEVVTDEEDESAPEEGVVLGALGAKQTEPHTLPSAYECFLSGFASEKRGEFDAAEAWYSRSLHLEPSLAAAHTNVGNIRYQSGDLEEALERYRRALDHEPEQAAARYNLGNILDEIGETELAIAELRQVVSRHPEFADAHYNLGLILFRLGGVQQAAQHLSRYLELDQNSDWSERAREILTTAGKA